jgi:bifunctional DNA-binding transcriptional regulator/antitoxin component of YhaV-PrlF toxin-antitoxin module
MALVSIRSKYHVVIPREVGEAAGVEAGDLLEAKVEAGRITLTPRSAVERGVAESLADFAAGRSYGPFDTAKAVVKSLHRESAKVRPKAKSKRKPRK